jgi:hypothetical protein
MTSTLCPVCGFDLGFPPWNGDSASDEICPSCGIQFGYDDASGGSAAERLAIYVRWRDEWRSNGMQWWSKGRKAPPEWDPSAQLRRVIG